MPDPLLPPALRRRRPPIEVLAIRWAVVLAALGLGLYLIFAGIGFVAGLISPADAAPAASPSATKQKTDDKKATTKCAEADIVVQVEISENTLLKGEDASISTYITSIATSNCFRDVGATANEVFVQDLKQKVMWSSDRCQKQPKQNLVTLSPGDIYKVSFSWYGNKNPKVCGGEVADLNRGEYELFARNGEVISEPVALTIE